MFHFSKPSRVLAGILPVFFLFNYFTANSQQIIKCISDEKLKAEMEANPQAAADYKLYLESVRDNKVNAEVEKSSSRRIIPVVFHVIHQGGSENISKDQILDQMRILNEDYQRLNADTIQTRAIFKPVAADMNVEFRLATKDPDGNCTDGIVRVYSKLTSQAGDNVKTLSWWNNTKYLNIWVVQSISSSSGGGTPGGVILGFSSFPGFGAASKDGIVILADYTGSIGTAGPPNGKGRTLTHEVGHYLGLFHPFQGACNPTSVFDENIADTPPVANPSFGCNLNANTCLETPDFPDQVENYMDYANGNCQNMFTNGQKAAINSALTGSRANLISTANLIATGTNGTAATGCSPKADFYSDLVVVCAGDVVKFTESSYNAPSTSRTWNFQAGNPTSSSQSVQSVLYNNPGVLDVSLTVSNANGNSSKTKSSYILVLPSEVQINAPSYFEGFENGGNNFSVINHDKLGNTWEVVSNVAYEGSKCLKMNNNSGNISGAKDDFILPSINISSINNAKLFFRVANAQKPGSFFSAPSEDALRVYVSVNCGKTWTKRYDKKGTTLSTAGEMDNSFSPTLPSHWREETVSLGSVTTASRLLIRFESISDAGNNIYIDNINIQGPAGIESLEDVTEFNVFPNPSADDMTVQFNMNEKENVSLRITDLAGRIVNQIFSGELNPGAHQINLDKGKLPAGMYFMQFMVGEKSLSKKIVIL